MTEKTSAGSASPAPRVLTPDQFLRETRDAGYVATRTPDGGWRVAPPKPATSCRQRSGRAPRAATNARPRGSRRSRASSASRGDPDDGGEPPRRCSCGCGADLTGRRPQTRYATAACRKRAERATPEQLERRHAAGLVAELAASGSARRALAGFIALDLSDRALVVRALELELDEDAGLLVLAPELHADMAVAA